MAVEANLGDYDNHLWIGPEPAHKLGWKDGDEELLDVYARNIHHRIGYLQAFIRGYLARRDGIQNGDHNADTQISSLLNQPSSPRDGTLSNFRLYREVTSESEDDGDDAVDYHSEDSKDPSKRSSEDAPREKTKDLRGDLDSTGNLDPDDPFVWPLTAEENGRAQRIEAYFLES